MRIELMNHALDQVPNRFALCQLLAKGTRRMHKRGDSFQNTLTDLLTRIDAEKLGDFTEPSPDATLDPEAVLFVPIELPLRFDRGFIPSLSPSA